MVTEEKGPLSNLSEENVWREARVLKLKLTEGF